jgi:hypothetical protein
MQDICQFFHVTKHHTEKPYNSLKFVHANKIDEDIGQIVEDGFFKYVSQLNKSRLYKKSEIISNTVVDMSDVKIISNYGARAIWNLNALHNSFLGNPIKIIHCNDQVYRQLFDAGLKDEHTFIQHHDLEILYGKTKHHANPDHD